MHPQNWTLGSGQGRAGLSAPHLGLSAPRLGLSALRLGLSAPRLGLSALHLGFCIQSCIETGEWQNPLEKD